jgi:Fe-S cluster biogenesis protein NfuA
MTKQDEFQQRAKSIETLVVKLESVSDPALRSAARDLVQALMELHGASIERMMEIVHDAGDAGGSIIAQFGRDELVRSVLLLYGLHPQDLHARVAEALEKTLPFLKSNSASAELVSVDEAGVVTIGFEAKAGGCGSGAASVKARIESALQDAAPDASAIVVQDHSSVSLAGPGFVSLAELQSGQAMAALSMPRLQRSGD